MFSRSGRALILAAVVATIVAAATPGPAAAELIFFAGERSMSVVSHRFEDDSVVVALRGGGEMTFDRALVHRIAPDEVPYAQAPTPGVVLEMPPPANRKLPSTVYDPIIAEASSRHDLDPRLIKAVIQVESGFNSGARSPKGAMGLMQLMPQTASRFQVGQNPYDPVRNIQAGAKYLRTLLNEFVELPLALAAYNAGEGAVRRFGGIPPYAETRAYVARILALAGSGVQLP
jgi:soluble lytic murein transglycosylase-like protein